MKSWVRHRTLRGGKETGERKEGRNGWRTWTRGCLRTGSTGLNFGVAPKCSFSAERLTFAPTRAKISEDIRTLGGAVVQRV